MKLEQVVPAQYKQHAHHWLILHGRYTCVARKPLCESALSRIVPVAGKTVAASVSSREADHIAAGFAGLRGTSGACSINSTRFPVMRLCTCTMKAMAKIGVAKLTTGIDTNTAITMPARKM